MTDYRYIDRWQKLAQSPLVGTVNPLPPPNVNFSLQTNLSPWSRRSLSLSKGAAIGPKVTELAEVTHILACHCEGCTPRSNLFPESSSPTHSFVIPDLIGDLLPFCQTQNAPRRNPRSMVCNNLRDIL